VSYVLPWPLPRRDARREEHRPLSTLLLIHDRLATSVLLFMVVTGLWGVISFLRGGVLSGSIAGTLLIGQVLIVAQVAAGVGLYVLGARPADSTHYLYGATAVLVLPFLYSYLRDRYPRQSLGIYSLMALFIAGLAVRGMTTGA